LSGTLSSDTMYYQYVNVYYRADVFVVSTKGHMHCDL